MIKNLYALLLIATPLFMMGEETTVSKATIQVEQGKTAEIKTSFDPCYNVTGYSIKITPQKQENVETTTQEFNVEVTLSH